MCWFGKQTIISLTDRFVCQKWAEREMESYRTWQDVVSSLISIR